VVLEPLLYAEGTSRADIQLDHDVRESRPTDESGYLNQLLGTSTWERLADLKQIDVPTLVLHGALDRLVPPMYARVLVDAIPSARLELLEGAVTRSSLTARTTPRAPVIEFFLRRLSFGCCGSRSQQVLTTSQGAAAGRPINRGSEQ